LDGVEIEDGRLLIARTEPMAPEAARPVAARLDGLLLRVQITEVRADVRRLDGVFRPRHPLRCDQGTGEV